MYLSKPFSLSKLPRFFNGVRFLNLHEYQSKTLLKQYGVRIQEGDVASTPEKAFDISKKLNAKELVIKAQIHAGGRGKGKFNTGFKKGVHVVKDPNLAKTIVTKMINNNLITKQTGPKGQKVSKVLIHKGIDFKHEYYLAIVLDRSYKAPVLIGSPMGGVNIEEVAKFHPNKILKIPIDISTGLTKNDAIKMSKFLGFPVQSLDEAVKQIECLYNLFISKDSTQIEINPFVSTTDDNKIYCVDAKINFDDNSSFRQKELFAMRDNTMEDKREIEANEHGLNYIGLTGNIGCMVNGAGLAMATMDIIKLYGGNPANFLDVGGGATEEQVMEAFKILLSDKNVKAILINIFGGIMRCDVIAKGIVEAAKTIHLNIPLVVRLEGTRVNEGQQILKESKMNIIAADDLEDAAIKVTKEVNAKIDTE